MKPRRRLDKLRELQSALRNRLLGSEKEAQLKTHRQDQTRHPRSLTDEQTTQRLNY